MTQVLVNGLVDLPNKIIFLFSHNYEHQFLKDTLTGHSNQFIGPIFAEYDSCQYKHRPIIQIIKISVLFKLNYHSEPTSYTPLNSVQVYQPLYPSVWMPVP